MCGEPEHRDADNMIERCPNAPDITSRIIEYEQGDMPEEQVIALFQDLVNSGLAWQLQGSYGRMAAALIAQGDVTDPRASRALEGT